MINRTLLALLLLVTEIDSNAEEPTAPTQTIKKAIPKYSAGLVVQDLSEELMNLAPAFAYGGALVYSTAPGSSSERAGLLQGDIITAVNNVPVRSSQEFVAQFQKDDNKKLELELDIYRLEKSFTHKRIILIRELLSQKDKNESAPKK